MTIGGCGGGCGAQRSLNTIKMYEYKEKILILFKPDNDWWWWYCRSWSKYTKEIISINKKNNYACK